MQLVGEVIVISLVNRLANFESIEYHPQKIDEENTQNRQRAYHCQRVGLAFMVKVGEYR